MDTNVLLFQLGLGVGKSMNQDDVKSMFGYGSLFVERAKTLQKDLDKFVENADRLLKLLQEGDVWKEDLGEEEFYKQVEILLVIFEFIDESAALMKLDTIAFRREARKILARYFEANRES